MENKIEDTVVELVHITPENASFFVTENGFLMIDTQLESKFVKEPGGHHGGRRHSHGSMPPPMPKDEKKSEEEPKKEPLTGKRRVFLHRAFPFDNPYKYISVSDENGEIGMVFDTEVFGENAELLNNELDSKYFSPKIKKIVSLKERFGYSYWKVKCDKGDFSFTVKDTFRNIIHVSDDRVIILDVDSNRFEIESLSSLDRKSFRKIELYI